MLRVVRKHYAGLHSFRSMRRVSTENVPLLALDLLACVVAGRIDAGPPHMGCFQSSSFISALCMLLGVWIRSVSPSLPCSPDDRITSHPVELVGSDHNPSCSRASGSGLRDHPFSRRVSARGVNPRSPPARIRRSRRVQLRWNGLVIKPLLECWSGIEPSGHAAGHAALNAAPSGTTPWVT